MKWVTTATNTETPATTANVIVRMVSVMIPSGK
jgi:hypothetical protein